MTELVRIPIEGMTCTSCVSRITRAVRKIDGIESVRVDLGSDSAIVGFDGVRTSLAAIGLAIHGAGYQARLEAATPFVPEAHRGLLVRLGLRGG
ncbi:MAG TPA: heavy-metal-associated domain-containing protein [Candidatus Limnocylindrales bacterium]